MAPADVAETPRKQAPETRRELPAEDAPLALPAGSNSKAKWIWLVVLLVIAGAGIAIYRSHAAAAAAAAKPQGPPTVPVVVAPVQRKDVPVYLTGLGSVTGFNSVTVKSRVDGQLIAVNFTEGQFVRAGELLAQIDPRPFEVALAQAQGQLAKDEATLKNAQLDLIRYQQLWQEGVISRQQFDLQTSTVGQIQGTIKTDQAIIDNQRLQITYSRITAPITGRVGLRVVDKGNIVHASDPSGLVVITQVQPIAVLFTLPEDVLNQVAAQMGKGQRLAAEAFSRDDLTKLASGNLTTMDNQIDPTTGTIRLKAVFDNLDQKLWPNQFVNIRLLLSIRKNALWIPSVAIQRGSSDNFVYVAKDGKAVKQTVQSDFTEGNGTVIASGLNDGDQVVVDGADKLQDGSKVDARSGSGGGGGGSGAGKRNRGGASPQDSSSQASPAQTSAAPAGNAAPGQTGSQNAVPGENSYPGQNPSAAGKNTYPGQNPAAAGQNQAPDANPGTGPPRHRPQK